MSDIIESLCGITEDNIAIYGLGTETERFLNECGSRLSIVGLLDGFRSDGELYGYPIIPIGEIPAKGVKYILVIARPGSCKAISKRIGSFCRENDIALFDVRGRDLLNATPVSFHFKGIDGESKQSLLDKIYEADIISFDLFDTLVMRKVETYTDVFELLDHMLRDKGIYIPDFARRRIFAEKQLSKDMSPALEDIYESVLESIGGSLIDACELAKLEWELDESLLVEREAVREIFVNAASEGKKVVITTDSYYSKEQIIRILNKFEIGKYDALFVSSEYGTAKPQGLFSILKNKYGGKKILHIGDDEYADIEKAKSHGIDTFRVYSALDLFDALGCLGVRDERAGISDRIKIGLLLSRLLNDPFCFEDEKRNLSVKDASDIGYLFCGPMIGDFTLWMKDCADKQGYKQLLFGARDGYLVGRMFRMIDESKDSYYFLSSRTAAIRAGMTTQEDIDYVDGMKYFGTPEEALSVRFGIEVEDIRTIDRSEAILNKAKQQRENYRRYIEKLGVGADKIALFDFVAKGTTQMYLQKLFPQHMKGFYFLQLEPEFMADKGLDIEPFYSNAEKDFSAIFDLYYILETILTAPYPQMEEMDSEGNPVFVKETRTEKDLRVFERAQSGILQHFRDYLEIVPESARTRNKSLDEMLLSLVNQVQILDEDFLSLKIEDPFFGRMTDIKDVIEGGYDSGQRK